MQKSLFKLKKSLIGGITVSSPVLLGAGVVKSPLAPELTDYLSDVTVLGAVTIGSITPESRIGNMGTLNWPPVANSYETYATEGGLHANGMRNPGIRETMKNLPLDTQKPLIISIAGYSTADYLYALETIVSHKNASHVKAIEVNCSCPTMGCAPLAYSLEALEELFIEIKKLKLTKPLWFKLSPYYTAEHVDKLKEQYPAYDFNSCPIVSTSFLTDLQKLLKEYIGIISAVIVSNGLPQIGRGTEIKVRKSDGAISTVAGLSGTVLMSGNLATIKFMKANGLAVDIIGCGGVLTKKNVLDYMNAGAAGVQCSGGPIWGGGTTFFNNLTK